LKKRNDKRETKKLKEEKKKKTLSLRDWGIAAWNDSMRLRIRDDEVELLLLHS